MAFSKPILALFVLAVSSSIQTVVGHSNHHNQHARHHDLAQRSSPAPPQKHDTYLLQGGRLTSTQEAKVAESWAENKIMAAKATEKLREMGVIARRDTAEEDPMELLEKRRSINTSFKVASPNAVPAPGFPYGSQKVRGVSLGGWLVLEPWIKPSLFKGLPASVVDEYTYSQYLGRAEATKRLQAHWSSWITEQDIKTIASYGLNHIRIPIGFWAIDISGGEPYVQGQYDYLKKAIGWAKKYNLKVLVDLHGAPGSQNGFDNSGRKGSIDWPNAQSNVDRTKNVVQVFSTEFSQAKYNGVVTSIQPLNEPAGFAGGNILQVTKQFYYDSYGTIRYPGAPSGSNTASNLLVALHDAFQPLSYWQNFMSPPQYQSVALDTHIYTVFSDGGLRMSPSQRIKSICSMSSSIASSNKNLWTIVGEFTPADTDCAGDLRGRNAGSAYEGTFAGSSRIGSCKGKTGAGSSFSSSFKTFLRKFWEVQVSVFEQNGTGWIMWAWKTETTDEWSYQKGVQYGWIPKDPTQRMYGNQCS